MYSMPADLNGHVWRSWRAPGAAMRWSVSLVLLAMSVAAMSGSTDFLTISRSLCSAICSTCVAGASSVGASAETPSSAGVVGVSVTSAMIGRWGYAEASAVGRDGISAPDFRAV